MSKKPSYWLLCLCVALLPWYIIRGNLAGIPITLIEVIGWLAILVNLIEHIRSHQAYQLPRSWVVGLLVWLAIGLISVVVSSQTREALGAFKAYFLLPVGLAVLVTDLATTSRQRIGLVVALSLAASQVALACLGQWLFHWPVIAAAELSQGRSSAFYNTANAVGLFLGPLVPIQLALAATQWKNNRPMCWTWLGLSLANLVAIALSQSTGAAAALIVTAVVGLLAWWLAPRLKKWPTRPHRLLTVTGLAMAMYAVVVLASLIWLNHPPHVANPYTRPGFTTLTVRQCVWQGTLSALSQSPIFGYGLAGFSPAYLKHYTCDAEPLAYPHNFILNFWSETGLAGLIAILVVSAWWLSSGLAVLAPSSRSPEGLLSLGLSLALVYWLVHGLVDVPYFKNDLAVEWWILIGLAGSLRLSLADEVKKPA